MKPGDLVRLLAPSVEGIQFRAPLWPEHPREGAMGDGTRRGWIQPRDVLLVLGRSTFSSYGNTTEWLEVAGVGSRGWVQANGFEVVSGE